MLCGASQFWLYCFNQAELNYYYVPVNDFDCVKTFLESTADVDAVTSNDEQYSKNGQIFHILSTKNVLVKMPFHFLQLFLLKASFFRYYGHCP